MSDIDIYKAINPLDYVADGVAYAPDASIESSTSNRTMSWSITAGDYQVSYNQSDKSLILMDQLLFTIPAVTNRNAGYSGMIEYSINLLHSTDHYLRRYCRISFGASFSGNVLSKLVIISKVTTPWNTSGYKQFNITCTSKTGTVQPTSITTPTFDVDWTDIESMSINHVIS